MPFKESASRRKAALLALITLAACLSCADLMEDTMYNSKKHKITETGLDDNTGIWDESQWNSAKWGE